MLEIQFIGKQIKKIGESAFEECVNIKNISIPPTVSIIGRCAFKNCKSLKKIIIPQSITEIQTNAFEGCNVLSTIKYKGTKLQWSNITIDSQIFYTDTVIKCSDGSIFIHELPSVSKEFFIKRKQLFKNKQFLFDGIREIPDKAFFYSKKIKQIQIPSNSKIIGKSAFENCISLKSISLPSCMDVIGDSAFCNCYKLKEMKIPEGITVIHKNTFENCRSLKKVIIPASVTEIEESAFKCCSKLTTILFLGTIDDWRKIEKFGAIKYGENWNNNVPAHTVNCSDGDVLIYNMENFYIETYKKDYDDKECFDDEDNQEYFYDDSFYREQELLYAGLTIPDVVTEIDNYAFANLEMTRVDIPNSVTKIGKGAFSGCSSLRHISLSKGLIEIGEACFASAPSLQSISLPQTIQRIHERAFLNCNSLTQITIPEGLIEIEQYLFTDCISLKQIEIPVNIKKIHDHAFENCKSLSYVRICQGICEIEDNAFTLCPSLKSVDYEGTLEQWSKIKLSKYSFETGVIINCTDGQIIHSCDKE